MAAILGALCTLLPQNPVSERRPSQECNAASAHARQHDIRRGHPWFAGLLTAAIAGWVGFNLLAAYLGQRPLDAPPFAWLGIALSLAALYMVILVYATQRREDQLTHLREQLTLELALLSEQKTAKVIELLEEFRRDIPLVHNRVDQQADAMAQPADPARVVEAIKETSAEAEQIGGAAP